jgi:glycosyltransferase involved in cell wall biosynthesis
MELSIIIAYHDEALDFIKATINSIKDTIDIDNYEIIIVDDFSKKPLENIDGVNIVRHNENKGVGAAFDTGVKIAKSENLFLMGSDIRFSKNKWASKILDEINKYPKSFTCTSCVALLTDNHNIEERRNINVGNGATILMFHDHETNPKKNKPFRSIIEAKWLPHLKSRDIDSFEIPCILGAAYGVKKSWYEYVDGWALHKKWGSLEPYISLKSWLFGGSCRNAPRVETAHIFNKPDRHGTTHNIMLYNKMMISTLLFEDYNRLISFLGTNYKLNEARKIYNENLDLIMKKREEYEKKVVYDYIDFFTRFEIDYRPEYEINY